MDEKKLPNLQILLAVLFSIAALFAPLLMTLGGLVMGILILLGLLLGGVSLVIGWRAYAQKRPVQYPFFGWSLRVLRIFTGEHEVNTLNRSPRPGQRAGAAPRDNLRLVGVLNLTLGGLLLLGMLFAALRLVF